MIIYGLKNCDKCRTALRDTPGATLRDIRDTPLSAAERTRFLAVFGDRLINQRSTTWRGLSAAERALTPDALLAAHPALMKRPVIEIDGVVQSNA